MKKPNKTALYTVLTNAIAEAALSRRAALHMELAVSLIHFTQETGGTDATGKGNLKSMYNSSGYSCMTKEDRDYKTVNRRLNAMSKLFDKLGSSLVNSWIEEMDDGTAMLYKVQQELSPFGFHTLDDVLHYVGVETNRTRAPRQPAGPVIATVAANDDIKGEGKAAAQAPQFDAGNVYADIIGNMNADAIREFCTLLLIHVAETEVTQERQAA